MNTKQRPLIQTINYQFFCAKTQTAITLKTVYYPSDFDSLASAPISANCPNCARRHYAQLHDYYVNSDSLPTA